MAKQLKFPLGFDLKQGTKEAIAAWKSTYRGEIQKAVDKKPIKLKLVFDAKGLNLKELKEYIKANKEAQRIQQEIIETKKQEIQLQTEKEKKDKQAILTEKARQDLEYNRNRQAKQALIQEQQLQAAKQRTITATNAALRSQMNMYKKHDGLLARMAKKAAVFFGAHQILRFLNNIKDVTKEMELQRASLGALIGSLQKADAIYAQIKQSALKSPFNISELTKYTKQLAAYKIDTDELFDTTMRLADVSAGLGVAIDRIILAYGQIRATGYLRATEVRQLTEAGIPIVESLAEKLTVINGRLVTAGEVMGMISERAVSFELVKGVFEDLTNAGGMFYKMQEKQAKTLYGQWENLKDAATLMYAEIGSTAKVHGAMENMIKLASYLFKHWSAISNVAKSVFYTFVAYKAVVPIIRVIIDVFKNFSIFVELLKMKIVALGKAMLRALPIAAIGAVITLFDEWRTSANAMNKALEKSNNIWDERERKLNNIIYAYMELAHAERDATEADEQFAKVIYSKKLEQLQKLSKEMEDYGLKGKIDFGYVNTENIDEVFAVWRKVLRDAQSGARAFSQGIATLNNQFEGTIFGWSIAGENLKSDMADLAESWNKLTLNAGWSKELERMRTVLNEMAAKDSYKEQYESLHELLGEDARLAIAQKRRNETEYQYQMRLLNNYGKIREQFIEFSNKDFTKTIFMGFKNFDETTDIKKSLDEVYQEVMKYGSTLMDKDPLNARIAIDTAAAENEWFDWQKEALIEKLNEDRLRVGLEVIPTGSTGTEDGVATGIKAIIQSQFKGLFTEDELSKLVNVGDIVKAITDKLKTAKDAYADALDFVVDPEITDEAIEKVKKELADIDSQIEAETKKKSKDQDANLLNRLQKQKVEYANMYELMKKQTVEYQEQAKYSAEIAQNAYDTFVNKNKTALVKNLKEQFPEVVATPEQVATDTVKPYQFTPEELNSIKDAGDLYDLWLSKLTAIREELKKLDEAGITEENINAKQAQIDAEVAAAQATLAAKEQEMAAYGDLSTAMERCKELKQQLNITKDEKERAKIEAEINRLLQDENLNRYISLDLERQKLSAAIQTYNNARASNEELLSHINALKTGEGALLSVGTYHNFSIPTTRRRGGGSQRDPWIELMKQRMKYMEDFQKGYESLAKKMADTEALANEQAIMKQRGNLLGIDSSSLENPVKDLTDWYTKTSEEIIKKIHKLGGKTWKGLGYDVTLINAKDTKNKTIKALQQLLAEIQDKMTDFKTKKMVEAYQKKLKGISEQVAKTKEAKNFFDNMLNVTGNKEYSLKVTMSLYGVEGDMATAVNSALKKEAETLFDGVDISDAFRTDGSIDFSELRKKLSSLEPDDDRTNQAKKFVEEGIKAEGQWLVELEKVYEKANSFEERRTRIKQVEAARRAEIEAKVTDEGKKQRLLNASKEYEDREITKVNLEQLKDSEDWVKVFENINRVGTQSMHHLMGVINEFIATNKQLTPTEMRSLMAEYNKLYEAVITRNPLKAMTAGTKEYFVALNSAVKAKKELKQAQKEEENANEGYSSAIQWRNYLDSEGYAPNSGEMVAALSDVTKAEEELTEAKKKREKAEAKLRKSQDAQVAALSKVKKGVEDSMNAYNALGEIANTIQDTFNVDEASDFGVALSSIGQALTMVAGVLGLINAMITLIETHPLVLAISAAIMAIIGGIMLFNNLKTRDAENKIKEMDKSLKDLEYSYECLEKAREKAFGDEYLKNYQNRLANLQAQQDAYLAQAEAERSKGKKADEEKIKDYEDAARDAADSIEDMGAELSEHFLGTDLTSAARDFADAWIEAYKNFANTADAMKEKFQEMIQNMIAESLLAKVMEKALEPVFSMIDNMQSSDFYSAAFWTDVQNAMEDATTNGVTGAENVMSMLEQMGINIRNLGGDMTGISRDIASASEESILGLAAGINTQNFYISQIPTKIDEIIGILRGGGAVAGTDSTLQDLITLQNQHLSYLPTIAQNTADTAERCQRAADACEKIASSLNSVIKPVGTQTTHTLSTSIRG